MEIIGVETPLIKPGDNLVEIILNSLESEGLELKDRDILVIASSVISTTEGNIRKIKDIEPSEKAKELSKESGLDERFVEIILQESDNVLSTANKSILVTMDGLLKINAGADRTNVPEDQLVLLPKNPDEKAEKIRKKLEGETGRKLGVVIGDSHVNPMRLGTTAQGIGGSGITMALDCRNQKDLYGRRLQITQRGIGDQLATAAQLVMGEADESIPVVIIRGVNDAFFEEEGKSQKISPERCIYSNPLDYGSSE